MASKRGTAAGGTATVDPLDLAHQGLRTAGRALSVAEREARERELADQQPPEPITPEEAAFEDQYEALQQHLVSLPTDHSARAEIYFLSPVPAGCEAPHKVPGAITDFRAIDDLGDEIERLIQRAGFWGSYKVRVRPKLYCPSMHVTGRGNTCPGRRWHFEGHHDLSLTVRKTDEAAEIAAANSRAAITAPAVDPITAARTMLEVGKALTPPAPEKSQAETLGPLVTSVATAFEKLASAQSGPTAEIWKTVAPLIPPLLTRVLAPPKDDFLEKLVLMQQAGMLKNGGGGGVRDMVEVFRMAMDMADRGGGGGDRSWSEMLFSFLDRHAESGLERAKDLIELARTRAARAPATVVTATTVPAANPALAEFQRELAQQAAAQNSGYFPTLRDRIAAVFPQGGPELLDIVSVDPAADQVGLERLAQAGLTLTPSVLDYLKTFCNWLRYIRRQQAPSPGATVVTPPVVTTPANGAGGVQARCGKCGTRYQLDNEQQWAEDSKVCDQPNCGGPLVRD